MADRVTELDAWQRGRRPRPAAVWGGAADGPWTSRPPALPPQCQRAEWAEQFVSLLRAELESATRRHLINAGESEQLVARLVLVVDQALSSG